MAGIYSSVAIKNLVPHSSIGQILAKSLSTYEPENLSCLSDEILLLMQKSMPLHVVKTDVNHLSFFAGWKLLSEFRRRNIETVWAVIHDQKPDEIVLWALQYELSKSIYTHNEDSQKHRHFYELLDLNKPLWRRIFTDPKPRTAVSALQKLCNLTRGYARKFSKKNQLKNEQANPLARLLEDLKKKDSDNDQ